MPNQDPSKDSKTSTSSGGFRNLFTKLFPKNSGEHDVSPQETSTSGERRAYVPRHANRDMLLAIPAERRSDLAEKANETRRQNAMAEIGFSAASQNMHTDRMQRENLAPVRRHSLASSSNTSIDHRPNFARTSSQRLSLKAVGPGMSPRRTHSMDTGTTFDRIQSLDRPPPDGKLSQSGTGGRSELYGIPRGVISRPDIYPRRTSYFSHSATRGRVTNKGKGRATEEEVQAAMLRDRAAAKAIRNPGISSTGTNSAPPLPSPTLTAARTPFGRWSRSKSPGSEVAGRSLEQLQEEQQSSRSISSIDGSVTTSHADSMRSFAYTEASTAATTITDQYSERGRSESEESKSLRLQRSETGNTAEQRKS